MATLPGASPRLIASPLRRTPIVAAVEQASPAVVSIHGRKIVGAADSVVVADSGTEVKGMGTGVIIDKRGYILTNYHVVNGVERIHVTLHDERTMIAEVVNHDSATDLAVIRVACNESLPVITTGTSADLMCGETVIAIGNAYGYERTVTRGIISALHRPVPVSDEQMYRDLIQTDASINPGNSGGPLLNIDGEMIGLNVAVRVGAQGIGFAIPVDDALEVAGRLLDSEHVAHAAHGITGKTDRSGDSPRFVVTKVADGSPAEEQGILAGDVITGVNGEKVESRIDFARAVLGHSAGEELKLDVDRGSSSIAANLTLDRAASPQPGGTMERAWDVLGLRLVSIPSRTIRQVSTRYQGGLRVVDVRSHSPADEQGIQPGDILVGIHKWETAKIDDIAYILDSDELAHSTAEPVRFYVLRGSKTYFGYFRAAGRPTSASR